MQRLTKYSYTKPPKAEVFKPRNKSCEKETFFTPRQLPDVFYMFLKALPQHATDWNPGFFQNLRIFRQNAFHRILQSLTGTLCANRVLYWNCENIFQEK